VVGALERHGIECVLAHTETAAAIMASVYGLLTGRVAAAVVTRGPGAASAVNGAAQATLDRHPLVLITDTVPAASAHRIPHQRVDQPAMLSPVCKRSATVGPSTLQGQVEHLIDTAGCAPAGAVHLDYDSTAGDRPVDEQSAEPNTGWSEPADPIVTGSELDIAAKADQARAMIGAASRPVVILGLAATREAAEVAPLRAAIERLGAPVLSTYQGIGALPTEHPQSAGLFTNGASERELLNQADLVLAVGLDMVEPIPAPWTYPAPVLALSSTPTTDPYLPIACELIGNPAHLADELFVAPTPSAGGSGWEPTAGAGHRKAVRATLRGGTPSPGGPNPTLSPVELVDVVATHAPPDALVTVDAGAHFLAVMPFWAVAEPRTLLISNGLATMGYAVPAAVAAGIADEGRPVICFVGDGGLGMTLAELETIGRLGLPVTVIVFNDSALSLIQIKQRDGHGGPPAVSYRETDFAGLAPSFGLDGRIARTGSELAAALDGDWSRPRLIDARVDPAMYRHLIAVTRG
jgi:acetolactate synthase-1/2/3 large subunit